MKGWPFSEAARKTIDFDDFYHQELRRIRRDVDDRVQRVLIYGEDNEKDS